MKKRLLILFWVFLLTLTLAACGEKGTTDSDTGSSTAATETTAETSAEKVAFALPYYPEASLHPITSDNRVNLTLAPLVYEGLFQLTNEFKVENLLCDSYSASTDYLQWTFTLRSGVCFSDGSLLTAADVVTSLNEARTSAQYGSRLAGISSVSVQGNAVVIVLNSANSNLPALLDVPILREQQNGLPLGTGPYEFAGTEQERSLTKNTYSWKDSTLFQDTIGLYSVSTATDLISAFDSGEISLVSSDLTGANALGFSAGYDTWEYNTTNMLYVGFNCASGACQNAAVRQALSRGMDRTTVTASLLAGHAVEAALPFSPVSGLYSTSVADELSYSPQAMLDGLKAAGYTAGGDGLLYSGRKAMTLTLVVNTDNTFKRAVAEQIAAQFESAGITVELQKLSYEDYLTALQKGNFDLYLGEVKLTADFDLTDLLSYSGALNYGHYSNESTVALLNTVRMAADSDRNAAAYALSKKLAEDAPFAVLCFKTQSVLTRWGMVSGLSPTRQNVFYGLENWQLKQ